MNQSTLIPLGLVITLGSIIFSLGQSYSKIDENSNKIIAHSLLQEKHEDKLDIIMQTLARIEERLAKSSK